MSAREFSLQLRREWEQKKEDLAEIVQVVAIEGLKRIVLKSPVDTGRFRGNWLVSVGTTDMTATEKTDKNGGATITAGANEVAAYPVTLPPVFIQNNLPYADRLEDGYSGQAPHGVVALTLAELETMFDGREV